MFNLPENPCGKNHTTNDAGKQTPLRDGNIVVVSEFLDIGPLQTEHKHSTQNQTNNQGNEGQSVDSRWHAVHFTKYHGISLQQGIGQAVNKRHV